MADSEGNKTGGRQKGTPNKKSAELLELAEEMGADPFDFLCKIMKGDLRDFGYVYPDDEIYNPEDDPDGSNLFLDKKVMAFLPRHMIPLELRTEAAKELMPYLHAKRKSVELKTPEDGKGKVFTLAYAIPPKKDNGST